jgi:hypothetical protein
VLEHRNDLTFPARDERSSSLVERLSEPVPERHADNFVSNEDSYPRVCSVLKSRFASGGGGVYVGVGPDQNFTLLAHVRPALAFIVDARRRNLLLHALHKALFCLSKDRVGYLERLTARTAVGVGPESSGVDLVRAFERPAFEPKRLSRCIEDVAAVLRPLDLLHDGEWPSLATIQTRLAGPGMSARFLALPMYPTLGRMIATTDAQGGPAHFLSLEALYQRVRDLQLGERLVPVVGDFSGSRSLARLGDWLRERGFAVNAFYTSDVEFFLLRAGVYEAFVRNLRGLPWTRDALIVRSSTAPRSHPARIAGDAGTTIAVDAAAFLERTKKAPIRTYEELFTNAVAPVPRAS